MIMIEQEVQMNLSSYFAVLFILATSLFTFAHADENYGSVSDEAKMSVLEDDTMAAVERARAYREEISRRIPATVDGDSVYGQEYQALMNSEDNVDYLDLASNL